VGLLSIAFLSALMLFLAGLAALLLPVFLLIRNILYRLLACSIAFACLPLLAIGVAGFTGLLGGLSAFVALLLGAISRGRRALFRDHAHRALTDFTACRLAGSQCSSLP